ncbi:MAG: 23S rRNA (adenine(2503)-C(2))-methyltransferase RlmN [Verrucomicrobiae bacterium]|nr:23S rRNA (adenine(2503)-C(2))-methyltransferase RlmN [Verrucomicrobiae bacterium]
MSKPNIKGMTREELVALLMSAGEPAYRADQILGWVYERGAGSFQEMTNLPVGLRERLAEEMELNAVRALRVRQAGDTTEKFLFQLSDGALIETVLIPATPGLTSQSDRHTVCVSSQVGCAYGCRFCASGLAGVRRNLTTAEIVDQVVHVQQLSGERVHNIVVMGMGEPLANYEAVLRALKILNSPWSLGIGARKMTISTVGLAPQIRRLAEEPMQIRLAISLHGATDEVRSRIMPVNRKYPLRELIGACEEYRRRRQRQITFEYILLKDVNDTEEQARALGALAARLAAKVNLIPYNPVEGLPWQRPSEAQCRQFQQWVKRYRVAVTLRMEKGTDINAACGQLRLQEERRIGAEWSLAAVVSGSTM